MDATIKFYPNYNPETISQLIYLQLSKNIELGYETEVSLMLKKMKFEDSPKAYIENEKEVIKKRIQNSNLLGWVEKSPQSLQMSINTLIEAKHLSVRPDSLFDYSDKIKKEYALNCKTDSLTLSKGYSFNEKPIFKSLEDHTLDLYLYDFINRCLQFYNSLKTEPNGNDFFIMVKLFQNFKDLIQKSKDYQKTIGNFFKPTIIDNIEHYAYHAKAKINHLKPMGFPNEIIELHTELKKAFDGQTGLEKCHNINDVLNEVLQQPIKITIQSCNDFILIEQSGTQTLFTSDTIQINEILSWSGVRTFYDFDIINKLNSTNGIERSTDQCLIDHYYYKNNSAGNIFSTFQLTSDNTLNDSDFKDKISSLTERAIALLKHYKDIESKESTINNMLDTLEKKKSTPNLSRNKIAVLDKAFNSIKEQILQPHPGHKQKTTLSGLITHEESINIIEKIKVQYKGIKGKRLKILLTALQNLQLLPNERIAKSFYTGCKEEFNWDIGTYQSMNDYKYNENTDKEELTQMKDFLNKITNTK
jgi:hypothetical protein